MVAVLAQRAMLEMDQRHADVVMIGSQVAFGSVGISAALPIMYGEGVRAVAVPTVVLSSMPRYAASHRQAMSDEWLRLALDDLLDLGIIDEVSTVMTGYFASASQVEIVVAWLRRIRESHPHIRIVVDPIMGDRDVGIYVPAEIAHALIHELLPLATGIVPNAFEFAHITGGADIVASARSLIGECGEWVIITSARESDTTTTLIITRDDVQEVSTASVDTQVKGAGDVFAAVLVAALHKKQTLFDATTYAQTTVRGLL
ncbi:PfkB family carbohydrate kinase [Corynebacterium deserti]|nr:PfkB family carbohydrate kinase [Corynebacterium deserti]